MKKNRNKKPKIIAMIPARMGSKRLTMKNLALLNGLPLIFYAIQAAKEAKIFERIVINSDNIVFSKIAKRYGVEFYHRPLKFATSRAKSDSVVYDFIKKNPCDITVWVNPISPFQGGNDIKRVVEFFIRKKLDSLVTVKNEQIHCLYDNKPINFRYDEIFAQTQYLKPAQGFVYSVMMWYSQNFIKTFEKKGYALLSGRVGYYPVNKLSQIIIKQKEDLMYADYMMRAIRSSKDYRIKYDKVITKDKRNKKQ